ncbi:hypothetical protein BC831DRAFT_510345 [Entophlyctis helioformis]|nr:hypothetical protein BC831DRAFT_510345 [Entophlyctis helioformis]
MAAESGRGSPSTGRWDRGVHSERIQEDADGRWSKTPMAAQDTGRRKGAGATSAAQASAAPAWTAYRTPSKQADAPPVRHAWDASGSDSDGGSPGSASRRDVRPASHSKPPHEMRSLQQRPDRSKPSVHKPANGGSAGPQQQPSAQTDALDGLAADIAALSMKASSPREASPSLADDGSPAVSPLPLPPTAAGATTAQAAAQAPLPTTPRRQASEGRPVTTDMVARRLIAGALGVRAPRKTPEEMALDRQKLQDARAAKDREHAERAQQQQQQQQQQEQREQQQEQQQQHSAPARVPEPSATSWSDM